VSTLSLAEYHRRIAAGEYDEAPNAELIEGVLVEMTRKTREHEAAIGWLMYRLFDHVDRDRFQIGVHSALTLEWSNSEPEPDLIVVARDAPRPYHYATAALAIEVSVSSLRHDLVVKRRLYAGSGVTEYWVIDVDGRCVVRHRDPCDGDYRKVDEVRDVLVASAIELPPLDLRELFAAAFS
jgi:Uma2 family endonuclease